MTERENEILKFLFGDKANKYTIKDDKIYYKQPMCCKNGTLGESERCSHLVICDVCDDLFELCFFLDEELNYDNIQYKDYDTILALAHIFYDMLLEMRK